MKDGLKNSVLTDIVKKPVEPALADMVMKYADTLEKDGTREIYARTSIRIFHYDGKATANTIDADWLNGFRKYLEKDLKLNTIAIYLRNIKTVINWMRRKKMTSNDPFLEFKIPTEITTPNNIPVEQLRSLLSYPCETWQEQYRDFFKLSIPLTC